MKENKRIIVLDSLRGIAALLVCLFHFTNDITFLPADNFLHLIGKNGWSGVQLFFLISGFVIPYSLYKANYSYQNSISSAKNFLVRRFVRIEIPYFVSILLVLFVGYLYAISPYYKGTGFEIDFENIFLHLFYINSFFDKPFLSSVYWTLGIEFQFYLLLIFVFPLLLKRTLYFILILTFWYALSFAFIDVHLIFGYMPYFGLGILLFRNYIKVENQNYFYFIALILLGICFFESKISFFVVLIASLIVYFKPNFKFLGSAFLASISYSLYLIHLPIGGRMISLAALFTQNVYFRMIAVLIILIICIIASYIYYLLIEKPSLNLANKINYKEEKQ